MVPADEPERTEFFRSFDEWSLRMWVLWRAVSAYGRPGGCQWAGGGEGGGEYEIRDGMLRLVLERGHSALRADDDDADVIEAMVHIRETINGNRDQWPETWGMTQAEWDEMHADGDRIRAAQAATAGVEA